MSEESVVKQWLTTTADGELQRVATAEESSVVQTEGGREVRRMVTLYNLDATIGGLVKQDPPNDGVLGAVGKLGVMPKTIAFDIEPGADGMNTGWLLADGALHKVDLTSGKATMAVKVTGVTGAVRDIAVMPGM